MKKWAAEVKKGRDSVADDARSGQPKDATVYENVKVVYTLVMCDRRRDLRSFGTVQSILTNILGMSNNLTRWVPRIVTNDQKRTWLNISKYRLSRYEYYPAGFIE